MLVQDVIGRQAQVVEVVGPRAGAVVDEGYVVAVSGGERGAVYAWVLFPDGRVCRYALDEATFRLKPRPVVPEEVR